MQYSGALFNLGKAFGMQGKSEQAAEAYAQAIQVHPLLSCLAFCSKLLIAAILAHHKTRFSRHLISAKHVDIW